MIYLLQLTYFYFLIKTEAMPITDENINDFDNFFNDYHIEFKFVF